MREIGTVSAWRAEKCWGFIEEAESGRSLFCRPLQWTAEAVADFLA
jgi:cold shock CspA family protein